MGLLKIDTVLNATNNCAVNASKYYINYHSKKYDELNREDDNSALYNIIIANT